MVIFFDTHAHLDYPEYEKDFSDVLARAQSAGITKIISIGTSLDSSRRAIALAEKFPAIYAAVGWHPSEALTAPEDLRPALRELAQHPKVVAIGETGLDCVIHQRASFDDTLAQLKPFAGKVRGVFHCFGESVERLKQILEIGSLVSYTGIVTFKNGQNIRDAVAATPLDKMMLETDCPYLAPIPHRGQRGEPAFVKEISETVAQVKMISLAELSAVTCRTAHNFFPKLV